MTPSRWRHGGNVYDRHAQSGNQVAIGASLPATLSNWSHFLHASTNSTLQEFTYTLSGNTLYIAAATPGTAGNSLTLAASDAGSATASGATLTGGGACGPNWVFKLTAGTNYCLNGPLFADSDGRAAYVAGHNCRFSAH